MLEIQNGKEGEAEEEEEEVEELGGINEKLIRQHKLPLSAQSAFSYIPPRRMDPPELSYFHQDSKELFRYMTASIKDLLAMIKNFIGVTGSMQKAGDFVLMRSLLEQRFVHPLSYQPKDPKLWAQSVLIQTVLQRHISLWAEAKYLRNVILPG
ncbi:cilia- and flagella-associated protein 90 isoform X2 [Anolis carolinensis]|uniref:cilia- and flagella-associated protein 90 isoform X2 n=1 Tax=Anolis carolinensis TaxID=28377 RepID=UPI002F2B59AE